MSDETSRLYLLSRAGKERLLAGVQTTTGDALLHIEMAEIYERMAKPYQERLKMTVVRV